MTKPRSHYDILNISSDAELVVIEAAYKALMKRYHPDHNAEALRGKAAEINQAFAVLKDPDKRAAYDKDEMERYSPVHFVKGPAISAPRSAVAMWSGWFVALLFAGVTAMIMNKPAYNVPNYGGLPEQSLASAASSQPPMNVKPPSGGAMDGEPSDETSAFIDALALEDLKNTKAMLSQGAQAKARTKARAGVGQRQVRTNPAPQRVRQVRAAPKRAVRPRAKAPAAASSAKDQDFLESRGYVY
jgi:curved DNA-binding protein CbpA